MTGVLMIVCAYLLGSIPSGFLLASLFGIDIRQSGSGNVGATNVARVVGKSLGLVTLLADTAKGWIPVTLALGLGQNPEVTALIGGAAFLGHLYPVFLRFNGGKGVATALGVLLAVAPLAAIVLLGFFFLVFLATRIVSLSSITTAAATPFVIWAFSQFVSFILMAGFLAAMVILRHRDNIERLRAGTEPKWGSPR